MKNIFIFFTLLSLLNLEYLYSVPMWSRLAVLMVLFVVALPTKYKKVITDKDWISITLVIFSYTIYSYFVMDEVYHASYFSAYYLYISLAYFIGFYSDDFDFISLMKKIFLFYTLGTVILLFPGFEYFSLESGSYRLRTMVGGPPASSFMFLFFSVVFISFKHFKYGYLSLFLMLLTGNRIAMLASIIILFIFYFNDKTLRRQLSLLTLMSIPLVLFNLTELLIKLRFFDSYGDTNMGTFDGRLVHWNWASEYFFNSDFTKQILGNGVNSTKEIFFTFREFNGEKTGSGAMHNEYIRVIFENGILGFIMVFYLMKRVVFGVESNINKLTIIGLVLSVMICSMTDNTFYSFSTYLALTFFSIGYLKNNEGYIPEKKNIKIKF
ncbi:O-antigen ligase family protein [Shewanella salipaludis]|uniref:O-antigen ligase family protein n=1 Tax=Shewanella salipaludis TaxID=2723052 RepID=A0A972JLE7_9GAMM|nr:O-antigen ligase family protein [Shewanella salipaludis]NMH65362.1 O-antigen ligase family protein [Shewanella salipaludis]